MFVGFFCKLHHVLFLHSAVLIPFINVFFWTHIHHKAMHEGYQHIQGDVVSRKGRTRTEGDVKGMAFVCVYNFVALFKKKNKKPRSWYGRVSTFKNSRISWRMVLFLKFIILSLLFSYYILGSFIKRNRCTRMAASCFSVSLLSPLWFHSPCIDILHTHFYAVLFEETGMDVTPSPRKP